MASQFDIRAIAKELVPDPTSTNSYETVDSEPPFAKSVRDASVLIQSNSPFTYSRLQRGVIEAFQRVYLRIASKKITNFSFVYKSEDAIEMLKVVASVEDDNRYSTDTDERFSRHSGAIHSVVRRIAAAELIRMIPLNSSVKFKEDSDDLIKEAYEDLERLLEVVASTITEEKKEEKDLSLGQSSVYIAYELDKANIPASTFDRPDLNSNPPTYIAPVSINRIVNSTNRLLINETTETAICTIYMTAQAYNADVDLITDATRGTDKSGSSAAVSLKIETSFIVRANDTIDSLIAKISEEINSATLNATFDNASIDISQNYMSNIIVAPEYQNPVIRSTAIQKKILYPNITTNEKRIASFDTYYRTNRLGFETRRNSTKVDTELLTIGFYTVPTANYIAPTTNINATLRNAGARLGINGLVYGKGESIEELQNSAPVSLFLNVSKGNVAAVSIQRDTASSQVEAIDSTAEGSLLNQIDTFYFHVNHLDASGVPITPNQPVFPTNDNELVLRISTSNYINEPSRLITINLNSINYPALDSNNQAVAINYIGEDIANLVVDALYNEARTSNLDSNIQSTNILGAQLGDFDNYYTNINTTTGTANNILLEGLATNDINEAYDGDSGRVQIVAFRYREQEYKAVVDIIKIPRLLWVATGNYQQRRTIWEPGRRRSISIETKDLKTSAGSAAETMTEAEILNSVNASVSQTEARKSALLQSVYDKKRLLDNVNYKGVGFESGYYRRPQSWLR